MNVLKTMKHRVSPANICVLLSFWLLLLCQPNLVHAGWITVTYAGFGDSPQQACELDGIQRIGRVIPYRVVWLSTLNNSNTEGFYRPGSEVQGPPIPNPENNYTPSTPNSRMFCVLADDISHLLFYYPDPKIIAIDPGHGFNCAALV